MFFKGMEPRYKNMSFNIVWVFKIGNCSIMVTFLNKCDELERPIIAEYYQRCMGDDLGDASKGITLPK